jgi:S1-C subfamily serine protease
MLAGCGGSSRTDSVVATTGTRNAGSTTAEVPPPAIMAAERSIVPVRCTLPNGLQHTGSGFQVANGFVTASHVVAQCANGGGSTTFGAGVAATIAVNDPQHDIALIQSVSILPRLRLETARVFVGERIVLLGIPGGEQTADAFPSPVYGTIVATDRPVTLTGEPSERLNDAIEVAIAGGEALPGNSGGPAIDAAGKAVGVIEGASSGLAILTPITDLRLAPSSAP